MTTYHPCFNDDGQPVVIRTPSTPTPLSHWDDPGKIATVLPGGSLLPQRYVDHIAEYGERSGAVPVRHRDR